MTDWFHKLTNWISYNRGLVTTAVAATVIVVSLTACQPKSIDPVSGERATQGELYASASRVEASLQKRADAARRAYEAEMADIESDVAFYEEAFKVSFDDIEKQKENANAIRTFGNAMIDRSGVPYGQDIKDGLALVTLLLSGGLLYDNRRKDKIIVQKKAETTPTPA